MAADKKFDVFLSHNSKDKAWVIKLKEALEARGIKVWLDKDEIRPGDLFAEALELGIQESKALALIISPEAMSSDWVMEEYYRALDLAADDELQLIPVLYKNAEIPGFLKGRNWVDFRDENKYEESVQKLIWGITGEKTLPKQNNQSEQKPTDVRSSAPVGGKKPQDEKPVASLTKKQPKEPEKRSFRTIGQFIVGALTLFALIWVVQAGISLELIVVPSGLIKWISASSYPEFTLWVVSTLIAASVVTLPKIGIMEGLVRRLADSYRGLFDHLFGLHPRVTIFLITGSAVSLFFLRPVCQSPTAMIEIRYPNNEVKAYDGNPIQAVPGSELTLTAKSEDSSLISCRWSSAGEAIDALDPNSICTTHVRLSDQPGRGIITLTLSESSCPASTTRPLEVISAP